MADVKKRIVEAMKQTDNISEEVKIHGQPAVSNESSSQETVQPAYKN